MTNLAFNPFIYGKPVPIDRFKGRQSEVRTVFSRLLNGESTAIVGEPHIGKSSLLKYIVDDGTRREWTAQMFQHCAFVDFDSHLLSTDTLPRDFWQQVVTRAAEQIEDEAVRKQCLTVAQKDYKSFELESLFRLIGRKEYRVALLIDEFDTLLDHPIFGQAEFLAGLRSLATRTDGLALITASRLTVAQMNRKSQYRSPSGSPFFNNLIEVRLPHLSQGEADSLLADTLKSIKDGVSFEPADLALVYSLAGRHPFLLQIAGASLFDAIAETPQASRSEVHVRAEELFSRRAEAHFDDYWRTLDEADQRTGLVLVLLEQASQPGQVDSARQQLGPLPWFDGAVRHLVELGAVVLGDGKARLTVGGFGRWMVEAIVYGTRHDTDFAAWLKALGGQNLLSNQEIAGLRQLADRRFTVVSPAPEENVLPDERQPGVSETQVSTPDEARPHTSAQRRHLKTQLAELQRRYDTLTDQIAALDIDIGRELDSQRRRALEQRRADYDAQRNQIVADMEQIEQKMGK